MDDGWSMRVNYTIHCRNPTEKKKRTENIMQHKLSRNQNAPNPINDKH